MRKSLLLVAALAFTPSLAMAENITIEEPWTRASLSSAVKNAAVYMVIANDAETPDALLKVEGTVADRTEVHEMTFVDDIMRMNEVESLEVPAKGTAFLEPGGSHIMLLGLKEPLKQGESFDLKLTFEKAGTVSTSVEIREPFVKEKHQH